MKRKLLVTLEIELEDYTKEEVRDGDPEADWVDEVEDFDSLADMENCRDVCRSIADGIASAANDGDMLAGCGHFVHVRGASLKAVGDVS